MTIPTERPVLTLTEVDAILARVQAYMGGPQAHIRIAGVRNPADGNRRGPIGHVTAFYEHAAGDILTLARAVVRLTEAVENAATELRSAPTDRAGVSIAIGARDRALAILDGVWKQEPEKEKEVPRG